MPQVNVAGRNIGDRISYTLSDQSHQTQGSDEHAVHGRIGVIISGYSTTNDDDTQSWKYIVETHYINGIGQPSYLQEVVKETDILS